MGALPLTTLAWLALGFLCVIFLYLILPHLATRSRYQIDRILLGLLRAPAAGLVVLYALVSSLDTLIEPLLAASAMRAYWLIAIVTVTLVLWRVVRTVTPLYGEGSVRETHGRFEDVLLPLVGRALPSLAAAAALLLTLWTLGLELSTWVAGIGALSFLLVFMLQAPLSNLFSGVGLLLEAPFRKGDLIRLGGQLFQVRRVGTRATELYDVASHALTFVPNVKLAEESIVNVTRPNVELSASVDLGVAYGSDIPTVEKIMRHVMNAHPHVLGVLEDKIRALCSEYPWLEHGCQSLRAALAEALPEMKGRIGSMAHSLNGHKPKRGPTALGQAPDPEGKLLQAKTDRLLVEFYARDIGGEIGHELRLLASLVHRREQAALTAGDRRTIAEQLGLIRSNVWHLQRVSTLWLLMVGRERCHVELGFASSLARSGADLLRVWSQMLARGHLLLVGAADFLSHAFAPQGIVSALLMSVEPVGRNGTNHGNSHLLDVSNGQRSLRRAFVDNTQLGDFLSLAQAWDKSFRGLLRRLSDLAARSQRRLGAEIQLTTLIERLLQDFDDTFMLPIPSWKRPGVIFQRHGESALDFRLQFFVDNIVGEHFNRCDNVTSEIRGLLTRKLAEAQIETPLPRRDISIRGMGSAFVLGPSPLKE